MNLKERCNLQCPSNGGVLFYIQHLCHSILNEGSKFLGRSLHCKDPPPPHTIILCVILSDTVRLAILKDRLPDKRR